MKREDFLLLASILCPLSLFAQLYGNRINIPGTGTALNSACILFFNPATPPDHSDNHCCIGTSSLFQLQAVQQNYAGICGVKKHSVAGISVLFLRTEFTGSYTLQGQYARTLFSGCRLGTRINLTHLDFGSYGRANPLNADLGLHYRHSERWQMGAYINQIRPEQIGNHEQSGAGLFLGVAFVPSKKVRLLAEFSQKAKTGTGLLCALEYRPNKLLLLRTSAQTNPSVTGFGIGYRIGRALLLETFGSYHLTLGLRCGLLLTVQMGSKGSAEK